MDNWFLCSQNFIRNILLNSIEICTNSDQLEKIKRNNSLKMPLINRQFTIDKWFQSCSTMNKWESIEYINSNSNALKWRIRFQIFRRTKFSSDSKVEFPYNAHKT